MFQYTQWFVDYTWRHSSYVNQMSPKGQRHIPEQKYREKNAESIDITITKASTKHVVHMQLAWELAETIRLDDGGDSLWCS